MPTPSPAASASLLRHSPLLLCLSSRCFSEFSYQIATVAVGWQIYELTGSAVYLGMVGLVQFIPSALLVFIAGHAADRYDRRRVVQACQLVEGIAAAYLGWRSFVGGATVTEIFSVLVVFGIASAFESPALSALLPGVAPDGQLQRATALGTGAWQVSAISGPAIGGLAYAISPAAPYVVMAAFWLLGAACCGAIRLDRPAEEPDPPSLDQLFAGVKFVRNNPAILGTISLDLFAVLLGGASALLPIYARDILHAGPWALGVMRAAPAVGALIMTAMLTRHPISKHVGLRMFQGVIAFGVAICVFALSRQIWLSTLALGAMGAADTVSVVIRFSLVQLATPDEMRGRVGAVNYLFVNASNQLGEFESGVTAALFGTVPAALIGGIGTVAVALLWMRLFPALRKVQRLE
ncbi:MULTISPECIES: MFS transporter [Bradyrhizobium]|mgnify:CR=1 FL=1|jgi:MFS family permease|uniref:MFS transporter n=1 Tax=Bradyrhizobium TaxID=374 RepID=UPI0004191EBC|nr:MULTISPECIES: MFS transporter [Bradyrhizobium]KIU48953.1 MFS transporter [Bradyrhizobium elkanii]MBK5656711.1 MFS transporter [Rhizobium sp.]OCX29202.1 MFS transporter [Bradyrhizobium sp. UASWS1016]